MRCLCRQIADLGSEVTVCMKAHKSDKILSANLLIEICTVLHARYFGSSNSEWIRGRSG